MTLYINFLAWIQRIISLACFANNVIHPWNQMILIFDQEMPAGFTHVICYTSITILSISPLWSTGETHLVTKTSKILFWTVMPSFEKSFQRPWLHGLKKKAKFYPQANFSRWLPRLQAETHRRNGRICQFLIVQTYFLTKLTKCLMLKACWL